MSTNLMIITRLIIDRLKENVYYTIFGCAFSIESIADWAYFGENILEMHIYCLSGLTILIIGLNLISMKCKNESIFKKPLTK